MNKKKCPKCGSIKTKRNGIREGVQLYKCLDCNRQFRSGRILDPVEIWDAYQNGKQTIQELAEQYMVSASSIKRRLRIIEHVWYQPDLTGMSGFIHLDATYWGHSWGIMLAVDDETGLPLYLAFIRNETTQDYRTAVDSIETAGYWIRGIIIDGKQTLFKEFENYPIQMCQFHMMQIVKRYLTKNPKMNASKDLMALFECMYELDQEDFWNEYELWKKQYDIFLNKRTTHKNGKTFYLHRRVRTLVNSIDFYRPYLFTYQRPECDGMPNTNNKIEGTFTDLKKNLNNHSGMSIQNRTRFISGYFLNRIIGI